MNKLLYTLTVLVALCPSLLSAQSLVVWDKNARYRKRIIDCGSLEHEKQFEAALSELVELIVRGKTATLKRLSKKYDEKIARFFMGVGSTYLLHLLFTSPENKAENKARLKTKLEALFDQFLACNGSVEWIERIIKSLDEHKKRL